MLEEGCLLVLEEGCLSVMEERCLWVLEVGYLRRTGGETQKQEHAWTNIVSRVETRTAVLRSSALQKG